MTFMNKEYELSPVIALILFADVKLNAEIFFQLQR